MTSQIKTELVDCPCCESKHYKFYDERIDLDWHIPGKYTLVECDQCQLIYLNPRPLESEFHKIYPKNYVPYQMNLKSNTRWMMKKAILEAYEGGKMKEIKKAQLPKNAKILDVGCGGGSFLSLLMNVGYKAIGIEPNEFLVEKAVKENGLDVRLGTLTSANLKDEKFDAITLWHALEHDPDPKSTISKCFDLLKPGGRLLLQVPDFNSKEAHLLKNYFWGNDIPRHLMFFTKESIQNMVGKNNFLLEEIHNTRNTTSWVWSLLNYFKINWYTQMEKNIGKIVALYLLLTPAHILISKGDWLTATFKKE